MARTRTQTATNNDGEKSPAVSDRRRRKNQEVEAVADAAANNATTARKDRPTPSARRQKKGAGSTGLINRIPIVRGLVSYMRGVSAEMQKVTWPSREDTTRLTAIVLGVTAAFAIALGVLDTFFSWWFRQAFNTDSEIIFLGIAAAVVIVLSGGYIALRNRI